MPQNSEAAFLAGSCCLAACYKGRGRDEEASAILEQSLPLANDVGLPSEDYHVPTRQLIGSMPEALTQLGPIDTELFLSRPVIT